MPHQRKVLDRMDMQTKIMENGFFIGITEVQSLEQDFPLQRRDISFVQLYHVGIGINERESAFSCRQPTLDLRPKRGQIQDGEHEVIKRVYEQIPRADSDNSQCRA